MKLYAIYLWLIAGTLLLLPMIGRTAAPPSHGAVLAELKELAKPVTYTEIKIPLGELIQKVAAGTGAKLRAAPDVADEPVAVVVKDLPARELLEQLADLLDYQWSRQSAHSAPNARRPTPTYEILQDLASKQREAALRDALIAEVQKRFQEEAKQYTDVAALPPDEFQRLVAAAEKDQKERGDLTPAQQWALLRDPAQRPQRLRFLAAMALRSPVAHSEARLLSRLTASQWTRLREEGGLTFRTDPRPGGLPLPSDAERLLRAAVPTVLPPGAHLAYPNPAEEEKLFQRQKQLQDAWSAATGFQVSIRLDTSQLKTQGGLNLSMDAIPYRNGAPLDLNFMTMGTQLNLMSSARFRGQEYEEGTPERRAALAADPVVGAPKLLRPEGKPQPNRNAAGAPGWWRLWDLLPDLARVYDVQFIADSYWASSPGIGEDELPKTPTPLFSILDRAAHSTHRWERRGSIIRLRSRAWFLDRPREVPLRFVRRWKQLFDQRAALPLDTYVEMATSLTDAQMDFVPWLVEVINLPQDLYAASDSRHALRLYSALTPDQRQALWRGEPIPVTAMSARQRELFAAGLQEQLRSASDRQQKLAVGRLQLGAESLTRVPERHEGLPGFRDDPATTATPAPSGAPATFPVTRITFRFQYGADETHATAGLPVANWAGGSP